MKKALLWIMAATAIIAIAYFAFWQSGDETLYATEKAKIANIRKTIDAVGEICAIKLVNVGAQVSGQIETIEVKIGDAVKKGDLIARIDGATQQNEIDATEAKLENYKAQLRSSEVALRIADSKYNRAKKLLNNNAVSAQEAEDIENEYETAKSRAVENASLIKQTEISLQNAKKNLAYATITAPLDGTIVSLPAKVGQTLNAALDAPVVAQIADLSAIEILVEISEGDILKVKEGQITRFSIFSEDAIYEAPIKSIDPSLTLLTNNQYDGVAGSNRAIYYYARIEYPNEEGRFRIGMTTRNIVVIDDAENVLTIPLIAVFEKEGRKFVKIIDGKKTLEREITIGISDDVFVEIKSGLNEGEEVVINQLSIAEIKAREDDLPEGVDAL
ncbi:MAG: efflux RND transporter periplasmic adaptor subunit [Helicobacteraceae bacterium]|jgi:macrolide-specific efflux system membrane fusion protein|nr:efflux RND transporter periplasmic adaptor subunit [Helicobacteraceae bacterium]